MSVQGNTVTGTVLVATEFRDFMCAYYDVIAQKLKNTTYVLSPYTNVTDLAAAKEILLLNSKIKCVSISSNFLDNTPPLNAYAENSSFARVSEDKRRRYVRGGVDWRQEVEL